MTAAQDSRAARDAFWRVALGDNSRLATLAKEAIAEAERAALPAEPVARTPLSNEECDRVIAALCPDFSDQRFPGDRPIMRQLARDSLASGITQEKQG